MSSRIKFVWAGEPLELLADRALYWPRTRSLLIADPHFGKPSAFRDAGIPVPAGTTQSDLKRINTLLQETNASRLVVLGDFFHHRTGQCHRTMAQLSDWRSANAELELLIIMGNHDRHSHEPPESWNARYERHPVLEAPFLLCHEPCSSENAHVLSGHIHPAISLNDGIGHSMRLPCFLFSKDCAMLPAFGSFTGTATVHPNPGDQIFAIADGQVIRISR